MKMVTACCTAERIHVYSSDSPLNDRFSLNYKTEACSVCLEELPKMVEACDYCGKKGVLQQHLLGDICELCSLILSSPAIQKDAEQKRVLFTTWIGAKYEVSLSLLSGEEGIVVKLYDGPPDSLCMSVYWQGEPADVIICDEVLDKEFYAEGTDPLSLDYSDGLLFQLQEYDKYDSDEYLLNGAMFSKNQAIEEAEKILKEKYSFPRKGALR